MKDEWWDKEDMDDPGGGGMHQGWFEQGGCALWI